MTYLNNTNKNFLYKFLEYLGGLWKLMSSAESITYLSFDVYMIVKIDDSIKDHYNRVCSS